MSAREMVDSGVEWIDEIPENWNVVRCGYIFSQRTENGMNTENMLTCSQKNGVIPQHEYEKITGRKLSKPLTDKNNYTKTYQNDIVYNKMRMWQGSVGISQYQGVVSPAYVVLKKSQPVVLKYSYWQFVSDVFISQSNSNSKGICDDQNSLSFKSFSQMTMLYPPISEQQSIANFLDHHVNLIDRELSLIDKKIELLGEKRKALIFECVTGKRTLVLRSSLTDTANVVGHGDLVAVSTDDDHLMDSGVDWIGAIPKSWGLKRVKNIFTLVNQRTSNHAVYIGMENIESATGMKISDVDARISDNGNDSKFLQGDILFGKLRPYLQKVWLADIDGSCSTEFFVLRPTNNDNKEFFRNMFLSQKFCSEVNDRCGGVKMPRANWDDVGSMLIPVPPISTQNLISKFLHDENNLIDKEISLLKRKQDLLAEKRKALIFEAVTGKIDCRSWTL